MDILLFLSNNWDHLWSAQQKIAVELSRRHRVFAFETFGFSERKFVPTDLKRLSNRIKRLTQNGVCYNSNLKIFSPPAFPLFRSHALVQGMNRQLAEQYVASVMNQYQIQNPLVWTFLPSPRILELADRFQFQTLVYECLDDFSRFAGAPSNCKEIEEALVRRAGVVFCSSIKQMELKKKINPATFLVHNASDTEHFAKAMQHNTPIPEDIAGLKKPVIGFIGSFDFWVDLPLIGEMAKLKPKWNFVLVGPPAGANEEDFPKQANVHRLGRKPYETLPAYLKAFDVALLPYKCIDYMETADPIVMYDYLAAGKPVLAADFPAAREMDRRVVTIAKDAKDFVANAERLLGQEKDRNYRDGIVRLRNLAVQNRTWRHRVEEQLKIIERLGLNSCVIPA